MSCSQHVRNTSRGSPLGVALVILSCESIAWDPGVGVLHPAWIPRVFVAYRPWYRHDALLNRRVQCAFATRMRALDRSGVRWRTHESRAKTQLRV